jgi:dTDP-4-amino-4,6-dideoxygalactose transaminase
MPITRAGESLDNAKACAYSVLSLPIHTEMTRDMQDKVLGEIMSFFNQK